MRHTLPVILAFVLLFCQAEGAIDWQDFVTWDPATTCDSATGNKVNPAGFVVTDGAINDHMWCKLVGDLTFDTGYFEVRST